MFRSTTIVAVRHGGRVAIGGDGQVSLGSEIIVKQKAVKIRSMLGGKVQAGFAGAAADAFALFQRFEEKLDAYGGDLVRAAVELAREWRTDRMLRRLDAVLIIVDAEHSLLVSGNGDVIEADDGILAVGAGAPPALAAARALVRHSDLDAPRIVEEALRIAATISVHTNDQITVREVGAAPVDRLV